MKEFDFLTVYAILFEMMGALLWFLVILAFLGTIGFIYVFIREGKLDSRRLLIAELIGIFGGFLALVIMATVTLSGFSDAGGPIDWLLIILIWAIGMVGTTILIYTAVGLMGLKRKSS